MGGLARARSLLAISAVMAECEAALRNRRGRGRKLDIDRVHRLCDVFYAAYLAESQMPSWARRSKRKRRLFRRQVRLRRNLELRTLVRNQQAPFENVKRALVRLVGIYLKHMAQAAETLAVTARDSGLPFARFACVLRQLAEVRGTLLEKQRDRRRNPCPEEELGFIFSRLAEAISGQVDEPTDDDDGGDERGQ